MDWVLDRLTDSAVVAASLAVAAWLSRKWIATRLEAAVRVETDKELICNDRSRLD
jgi:hypothetical protein